MSRRLLPIVFLCIPFPWGCADLKPQLGFTEVQQSITERIHSEIYWSQGTAADTLVQEKVSSLFLQPLTPETAVQIALLNNRHIQAVYENLNLAQADLVEAGLLKNPILNGDIRFPGDGANFELSVVEDFVSLLQIPLRKKIAAAQFEEAKIEVIGKLLDLAARTKIGFYDYQAAEHTLEVARTALVALESAAELAKRLYDAGNITELELNKEQAAYQERKLEVAELEQDVIRSRESLNMLLGESQPVPRWKISNRLPEAKTIELREGDFENQIVANSVELAASKNRLTAAAASVGLASEFAIFRSGELGGSASKEGGGNWGFGPALSIPIPFFNQGQPEIFRTHAELRKQLEAYADLEISIRAQARSLLGQLRIAEARSKYFKETLLPLQSRIVHETQKRYNGMLLGAFQLLSTKAEQIRTTQEYVRSLKQYWILRCEFESILNGKAFLGHPNAKE